MQIFTGKLPSGFRYIPQDNYLLCNPETAKLDYLYSDSATSCIILIVVGKGNDGSPRVALTHLSRELRFQAFFDLVEREFAGGVAVYAQGANPPFPVEKKGAFSYDAIENVGVLLKWIAEKTFVPAEGLQAPKMYIQQCTISVGAGDPNTGCGAYGIDINPDSKDYLHVSNKFFPLTAADRDPEKGIQTLFCIFGIRSGLPSLVLHNAEEAFTEEEKDAVVAGARERDWTKLLEYSPAEILDKYSTTPAFEPSWFCDHLIESAQYVKSYKRKLPYAQQVVKHNDGYA